MYCETKRNLRTVLCGSWKLTAAHLVCIFVSWRCPLCNESLPIYFLSEKIGKKAIFERRQILPLSESWSCMQDNVSGWKRKDSAWEWSWNRSLRHLKSVILPLFLFIYFLTCFKNPKIALEVFNRLIYNENNYYKMIYWEMEIILVLYSNSKEVQRSLHEKFMRHWMNLLRYPFILAPEITLNQS